MGFYPTDAGSIPAGEIGREKRGLTPLFPGITEKYNGSGKKLFVLYFKVYN